VRVFSFSPIHGKGSGYLYSVPLRLESDRFFLDHNLA
jgi:hypothetical protein